MFQIPRSAVLTRVTRTPCVTAWRGRKSRHDPPAKSKVNRIKYPPLVPLDELLNVQRRYKEYSIAVAALRSQFKSEMFQQKYEQHIGSSAELRHQQEAQDYNALLAWNLEENKKALIRRLERLRLEDQALQLQREEVQRIQAVENLKIIREREEEVERLQEISKTFITPENLIERIESALDNPKSYNFCLDQVGRIQRQTSVHQS